MIITAFYAGLLGLLYLVLSLRVVQLRRRGIPLGDGGDPRMLRVIRGHANFAEYVPLILVLMLMLELARTSLYVLHALGIALVVGRVLHCYSLSFSARFRFGRLWGAALTFVVLLVAAVLTLIQGIRGLALA
jgi:uncharacterized membrane protein YecN with MAPEG domain